MNTPKRQHGRSFFVTAFVGLLALSTASACNQKEDKAKDSKNDAAAEEKKQAQIDALLRENGTAPVGQSAPAAPAKPTPATGSAPTPPGATAGNTAPTDSQIEVKLVSAGSGPKQMLSYQFQVGRERKFAMDMEILSSRITNGQKEPGPPPITLSLTGTTQTVEASATGAKAHQYFR